MEKRLFAALSVVLGVLAPGHLGAKEPTPLQQLRDACLEVSGDNPSYERLRAFIPPRDGTTINIPWTDGNHQRHQLHRKDVEQESREICQMFDGSHEDDELPPCPAGRKERHPEFGNKPYTQCTIRFDENEYTSYFRGGFLLKVEGQASP